MCYHILIFPFIFSFQKAILPSIGTVSSGLTKKKNSALRYDNSINLLSSLCVCVYIYIYLKQSGSYIWKNLIALENLKIPGFQFHRMMKLFTEVVLARFCESP